MPQYRGDCPLREISPQEIGVTALDRSPPWVFHVVRRSVSYLAGYESYLCHFWLWTWLCTSNCASVSSSGNGGKSRIPLVGLLEDPWGQVCIAPAKQSGGKGAPLCWMRPLAFLCGICQTSLTDINDKGSKESRQIWELLLVGVGNKVIICGDPGGQITKPTSIAFAVINLN